jgi:LacI family transcriptional regulator
MKHPPAIDKVTVKDLARQLGISRGTIDRAFHDRPGINLETKKLILEKAKELGYQTNRLAQTLSRKKVIKIGYVIPQGHGPYQDKGFFSNIEAGIVKAYHDLQDHNLRIIGKKTDFFGIDPRMQIGLINEFLEENIDGLILSPEHRTLINTAIDGAVESGVHVVTVASDAPESRRMTCVSTNPYHNGQVAGDLMSNFLRHRGKVAIMTGSLWSSDHQEKVRGFTEVISSAPNSIETVGVYETLDQQDRVYRAVQKAIGDFPDLAGIYINTATDEYGCKALMDAGKGGEIFLIGTDLLHEIVPYIEKGVMQAAIFQDPFRQGYQAVKMLFDTITTGKKYGPFDYTKPDIITRHNISYFMYYD